MILMVLLLRERLVFGLKMKMDYLKKYVHLEYEQADGLLCMDFV